MNNINNIEELDEGEEIEFDFEPYSPHENIAAAFNALAAIEAIDEGLMKPAGKRRLQQIRRKSLFIIHSCINDIYDMVFDTTEASENNNDDDEV